MWLLLAMSCTGGTSGDGEEKAGEAALAIVSPAEGDTFPADGDVPLEVEATVDGRVVEAKQIAWTVGDWTGTGATATATDLRPGAYTVEVSAVVEGETLTDSVAIEVTRGEGDADTDTDTDTDADLAYAGMLEADVYVETNDYGDFDDHCSAPITLTVDGIGGIAGQGTCTVFEDLIEQELVFAIEGRVNAGVVSGDLVLEQDGEEARTPYEGTGDRGSRLQATFDTTHSSRDGSIRIAGTWLADPQ
ncbi:MAG: hypothetical protein ACOZNI_07305 [Myxococcota bacterium]